MVSRKADGRTDRGQLVLIGAISIAFILLGVVVVLNGVQYTETVSSGGAGDDLEEVRTVESEIAAGLATIDGELTSESDVEDYVEFYSEEKATQKPIYIKFDGADISGKTVTLKYRTADVTVTRTVSWT